MSKLVHTITVVRSPVLDTSGTILTGAGSTGRLASKYNSILTRKMYARIKYDVNPEPTVTE